MADLHCVTCLKIKGFGLLDSSKPLKTGTVTQTDWPDIRMEAISRVSVRDRTDKRKVAVAIEPVIAHDDEGAALRLFVACRGIKIRIDHVSIRKCHLDHLPASRAARLELFTTR